MANTKSRSLVRASSQYLGITDAAQTGLDLTTDFTIEWWQKLTTLPSAAGSAYSMVSKLDSGSNLRQYQVFISTDDKVYFDFYPTAAFTVYTRVRCDTAVTSGAWQHIAVAVDISAANGTFYYDTVSKSSTVISGDATTIVNSTADFTIGARKNSGTPIQFVNGLMDEVRVWSDIRTSGEISANWKKELSGAEGNLVGYWQFDDDDLDVTSNNNDLTPVNSPTFSTDIPFIGASNAGSRKMLMGVGV